VTGPHVVSLHLKHEDTQMSVQADGPTDTKESTTRDSAVAALGIALLGVAVGRLINLSETLTLALALVMGLIAFAVAWRLKPTKGTALRLFTVGFIAAFIGFLVRMYLTVSSS
jgi:hypothetical protein